MIWRSREDLAAGLISALGERQQTVAVAESLTGGLVTAAFVAVPGASAVLRGGVVAYATAVKHDVLGVDRRLLEQQGPVDPEVAVQLARGVRDLLGADWGLSTTGVAGPGAQDGVPPGRVFIGLAGPDEALASGPGAGSDALACLGLDLPGGRDAVRAECVRRALEHLAFALSGAGQARGPEQGGFRDR